MTTPTRTRATQTLLAALIALFALAGPAFAHHKDGHDNGGGKNKSSAAKDNDGDADSDSSTAYTEDNDTNDGGTPNNVPDDGDNAHPSGKDRSVENGKSGNQGKAESDPDDDGRGPDRTNGGPDKPNGSGGVDKADQDGNNGCGNDDDFEDDNEGWCGKKPKTNSPPSTPKPPHTPCDADATMPGVQKCTQNEPPVVSPNPPIVAPDLDVNPSEPDRVQGVRVTEDEAGTGTGTGTGIPGTVLPFTGGSVIPLIVAGLGLMVAGSATLASRKRR